MLKELANVQQVRGEPRRRWFFSHEIDLVVWEENGAICGFQLAYDKDRNEHSLYWDKVKGFTHYVVDDGEPTGASVKSTPFLNADGPFRRDRVLAHFLELSAELPADITAFVQGKLHEYNGALGRQGNTD